MAEWDQRTAHDPRQRFVWEFRVESGWGKLRKVLFKQQPGGQLVCVLFTASGEKKEGWSWEPYLEEQKAVTAPVSLFQDVSQFPPRRSLSSQARDLPPNSGLLGVSIMAQGKQI